MGTMTVNLAWFCKYNLQKQAKLLRLPSHTPYLSCLMHANMSYGVITKCYVTWRPDLVKKTCRMAHILVMLGHMWPKLDQLPAIGGGQDHFQVVLCCTVVENILVYHKQVTFCSNLVQNWPAFATNRFHLTINSNKLVQIAPSSRAIWRWISGGSRAVFKTAPTVLF